MEEQKIDWEQVAYEESFTRQYFIDNFLYLIEYTDLINLNPQLDFDVNVNLSTREQETYDECIVCYDPTKTLTPCGHLVCEGCIKKSLKYTKRCPYCRFNLALFLEVEIDKRIDRNDYEEIPDDVLTADIISDSDEEIS